MYLLYLVSLDQQPRQLTNFSWLQNLLRTFHPPFAFCHPPLGIAGLGNESGNVVITVIPCHRQHRLFSSLARPVLASFSIWHLFASVPVNQHNCYTHTHTHSSTLLAAVPLWKHSTDSLFVIVVDFAFCEPWKKLRRCFFCTFCFCFCFLFLLSNQRPPGSRRDTQTSRQTDGRTGR